MGELVRAGERAVLRGVWAGLSPVMGSSHPNYRRALWSPRTQGLVGVALSEPFAGVEGASGWYRRSWDKIGIMAVRSGAMEELLKESGARPAVAFRMGSRLVVGELADPDGFARLHRSDGMTGSITHGFRLGPDEAQFAIGVTLPDGEFVTPSAGQVRTFAGALSLQELRPGLPLFDTVNFS